MFMELRVEFLTIDLLGEPAWLWLSFLGIVGGLLAFDLGILHRQDKELGAQEGEQDMSKNPIVRLLSTRMRVSAELHASSFFVRQSDPEAGKLERLATPQNQTNSSDGLLAV
jgi:hypothetical protein